MGRLIVGLLGWWSMTNASLHYSCVICSISKKGCGAEQTAEAKCDADAIVSDYVEGSNPVFSRQGLATLDLPRC